MFFRILPDSDKIRKFALINNPKRHTFIIMNKYYFSKLTLATLLCMILLGASSCKKDDNNGGETPDPTEAEFFIDVNYLPEEETNGELAPRLMVNLNDEAVMIELRQPSADTVALETVLILCPDNEATLMCGNDKLMVCAAYDVETCTPSNDVLLVTPMNDDALVLTRCVMDWNTNTMTKGEMMILPIDENSKSLEGRGDITSDPRGFFYNHFVKRVAEYFERGEDLSIISGMPAVASALHAFKLIITTGLTNILFSDDSEELYHNSSYPVSMWAAQETTNGIVNYLPLEMGGIVSRGVALFSWFASGGYGKVNDYEGTGGSNEFSYPTLLSQSSNVFFASDLLDIQPPYNVSLSVSNVTENSAYLKGHLQFTSSITPIAMGYVFKVSGGPEQIVEDMNFRGKTVSDLQKATKYTAYAYVESVGDRVVSSEVTFWTLGFEAFPTALTFPVEGDTKYVALSYSEEDIVGWDITSKPSWCSTSVDDLGLLAVTVGESTETRSGTITITAHSNALGNLTQDIAVTQLGTTPQGYFTGTPFNNVQFTMDQGSYTISTTWTERCGDDYNAHTHTYSSFHNETHTNNETQTINLNNSSIFSFSLNTLNENLSESMNGLYLWSWNFVDDDIIIYGTLFDTIIDNIIYKNCNIYNYLTNFNNILEFDVLLFPTEILPLASSEDLDNGTFVITRYFEHNNVFCIKEEFVFNKTWQWNENNWGNNHGEIVRLNKFIIDENSHTCTFDIIQQSNYSTPSFGSQFTGTLSSTETEHWTINGTWARTE